MPDEPQIQMNEYALVEESVLIYIQDLKGGMGQLPQEELIAIQLEDCDGKNIHY
ncbi:hypothetical protein [Methanococcoides alaskense]|uniref:Uncharacterized protein n=1 Tax=Methanococcoides alaskense TaxID=325778 RepID=A0AA90TXV5_9EURY|nr:hypothetical protein [Methanococcoides alaskense]MDA0525174.1 hypothetical protein [Methanococcoides alaskense]MDR6221905.1 hypothetical protein [Methanococcoides alaskense]